jgi:hypothetical protein
LEGAVFWVCGFCAAVGPISYVWACNEEQTAKTSKIEYPIFRDASLEINESHRRIHPELRDQRSVYDKAQGSDSGAQQRSPNHAGASQGNGSRPMTEMQTT